MQMGLKPGPSSALLTCFKTWLCRLASSSKVQALIYFDNHATTPLDPTALDAMLPLLQEFFANAGSVTHEAGRHVAEIVERSIASIATAIGAAYDEVVITSGATESNNLALLGTCLHPRQQRRKIVSVVTEHKAVLDPLLRLQQLGFEICLAPVVQHPQVDAGRVDMDAIAALIDAETALVSVMLANNEIGVIQPIAQIAELCRGVGCLLHTDATQAVGRMKVDVDALDVDLLSFSAHKCYGPKGVGALFVRRRERRVKLQSQIVGGGQQHNFRSGTLNTAGIVGMEAAISACSKNMTSDQSRILAMRNRLYDSLNQKIVGLQLNGPALEYGEPNHRLAGNLNCCFYPFEGQSLMLATPQLAVSSGSACTSANPSPSHVLQAVGRSEEESRSSLRFGIGRFNSEDQVDRAAELLADAVARLQSFR